MPLTITQPLPNTQVGPATFVSWQQSTLPIPNDDYYVVRVVPQATELQTLVWSCQVSNGSGIASTNLGTANNCLAVQQPGLNSVQQGEAVRLLIEQFHANGVQVDSLSQAMTWDGAGPLFLYGDTVGWGAAQVQAGFTPSDRDKLQAILDAVYQRFPHA